MYLVKGICWNNFVISTEQIFFGGGKIDVLKCKKGDEPCSFAA